MISFNPQGPILSFTSASSAPTSVHAASTTGIGTQDYRLVNIDSTNDAVVGWGSTDAEAKLNSAVATGSCKSIYVQHGTSVVVNAQVGAYFSGIAVASTAIIKVQTGYSIR